MAMTTGLIIGAIILVCLIIFFKLVSKGNLLDTLRGGVAMVDKAGTGNVCEVVDYQVNELTGKVRLNVNYLGKGKLQTGFWFDPNLDFYPALDNTLWENYMGTIICYKDLETGRRDFKGHEIKMLTEKVKVLSKGINLYKKQIPDILNYLEGQKLDKKNESEVFMHSKALNAVKKLATAGEEVTTSIKSEFGGMINS